MVYKCDKVPWSLYVGWALSNLSEEVNFHAKQITKKKFDFLMLPFFPPITQRNGDIQDFIQKSFIRADLQLLPSTLQILVIKLSEIDITVEDKQQRKFNKHLLRQEIQYADYLGIGQVVLKVYGDPTTIVSRYHKFLKKLGKTINCEIILEFTLSNDQTLAWHHYNEIRQLAEFNVPVYLQMSKELPNKSVQKRWMAENVRCIGISADLFTINDKGYPQLADQYETFLKSFFPFETRYALSSVQHKMDLSEQRELLCHIFKKQEALSKDEFASYDYYDVLQEPLQPYKDNLHSYTYDVFEQDAPKYNYYETACFNYFKDNEKQFSEVLLAGAGRGGILKRIIKAAQLAKVKFHIVALEKNQFAYLTLIYLKEMNKWNFVDVVLADLKTWDKPPTFDLIVSELLGSFGDNELSPECLNWAKKFIKPEGISIPYNSVNFITPISCPMIHQKARKQYGSKGLQRTYVINLKQIISTSTIEPCFEFIHFEPEFVKEKTIHFKFKQDYLIHGLGGYFESILYKETKLSIHPETHTPNMLSWFPLYLPFEVSSINYYNLQKPINVKKNEELQVQIARRNDGKKVWYEWTVDGKTHNLNGEFQAILFE